MLAKIAVADYMSTKIISVSPDTEVSKAIQKMLDHKITSLPVLDDKGNLVGIFSEKDGMKVVVESAYNQGMAGKVEEFMTKNPTVVGSDTSLVDVAEKFHDSAMRSFPVEQDGKFAGMISRVDVLRAIAAIR